MALRPCHAGPDALAPQSESLFQGSPYSLLFSFFRHANREMRDFVCLVQLNLKVGETERIDQLELA